MPFLIMNFALIPMLEAQATIGSITVNGAPENHTGSCPVEIKFTAVVQAEAGRDIVYQWQRSDRAIAPEAKATLVKGENVFTASWTLGDASTLPYYSGWQSFRVLHPSIVDSNEAKFSIRCTGNPAGRSVNPEQFPPFRFRVNQSVRPNIQDLPSVDGQPRLVASVIGPSGAQTDFAENELMVMPPNEESLRAFLIRTRGEILATEAMKEVEGLNPVYLVRVHPGGANLDRFNADLRSLGAVGTGDWIVSSEMALRTLALAAREAASRGIPVAINPVTVQHDFARRTTSEAPVGPSGTPVWNSNAFTWPYITRRATAPESNMNIGVGDAWRLLQLGGLLGNRTGVAVLDAGFQRMPDMDFELWRSPLRDDERAAGRFPCSGGAPCPFHGTDVVSALAAIPDNGLGAAGPGGPVVNVLAIERGAPDTFFGIVSALVNSIRALASGRRIVNMSFGADIDAAVSVLVIPVVDPVFALTRAGGTLVFAGAGNAGVDIDGPGVFGEAVYHLPCESPGVFCVGGLAWDSRMPSPGSNFGSSFGAQADSVELFAPFGVWVGAGPGDVPFDVPKIVNGTSFSSPFTAGVAALIAAANPRLSTDRIERLLLSGANRPSTPGDASAWVNAFLPVAIAAGSAPPDDFPPNIQILSPSSSSRVDTRRLVSFIARASDFEGAVNVTWNFPDGGIATGPNASYAFREPGTHTVTATATDSSGRRTTASVDLLVVNPRPEPRITYPVPGQRILAGQTIVFRGEALDRNEGAGPGPGVLPAGALSWRDDRGELSARGDSPSVAFRLPGLHRITLTAVDSEGAEGIVSIDIDVVDDPAAATRTVAITSPATMTFHAGDVESMTIRLQGISTMPTGSTHVWYAEYRDSTGTLRRVEVGRDLLDFAWRPASTGIPRTGGYVPVTIYLVGTDGSGRRVESAVSILVGFVSG